MLNDETLQQALRHVLWIGGAPDAGKTSVAAVLVEKYGLQFYSLDEHAEEHWFDHVSKDPSAFGHAWMSRSLDERWLQPPEQQLRNVLRITEDDFPLVVTDLLAMPKESPILVEGNVPPELVEPLLATKQQAIWLIPTESFALSSFLRREKHVAHNDRRDPRQTKANHIARDRLLTEHVQQEALTRNLKLLEVDDSCALMEVVALVEAHFGPVLNQPHSS